MGKILRVLICCHLVLGLADSQQMQRRPNNPDASKLSDAARSGDQLAQAQLRALAAKEDAVAAYILGSMYQNGEGVVADATLAITWYRKAAAKGYAEAQYWLGWMYDAGEGVSKDAKSAAFWYLKAAGQGNVSAQYSLGKMYESGSGVTKDMGLATTWYRKAAEQGDIGAQKILDRLLSSEIALRLKGGVFVVPVLINDRLSLDFVLDSGASDVALPADVVLTLLRTGTLKSGDFTGTNTYQLADGSRIPSKTFRIRSLQVGDVAVENVQASLSPVEGTLLLGQSFLSRFKAWGIDNKKRVLVLTRE